MKHIKVIACVSQGSTLKFCVTDSIRHLMRDLREEAPTELLNIAPYKTEILDDLIKTTRTGEEIEELTFVDTFTFSCAEDLAKNSDDALVVLLRSLRRYNRNMTDAMSLLPGQWAAR